MGDVVAGEQLEVWRFIERDPTAATLATAPVREITGPPGSSGGAPQLTFSAALTDGTLTFILLAQNRATEAVALRLGLDLVLVGTLFSAADGVARVDLPRELPGQDTVVRLGSANTPFTAEVALRGGTFQSRPSAPQGQGAIALTASARAASGGPPTLGSGERCQLTVALRATPSARAA